MVITVTDKDITYLNITTNRWKIIGVVGFRSFDDAPNLKSHSNIQ